MASRPVRQISTGNWDWRWGAYDDSGNSGLGVAVLLEVLGHGGEDTGGKSHVEDTVGLRATLLNLLKMLQELDE